MKALALPLMVGFSLLLVAGAAADPLPRAKADDVGLSSERLDRIGQILRADVERGRIPGAVVIVARKGRIAYFDTVGFRDKSSNAAMPPDAIFRIASMTKPLVSVATMMLYEEGRLLLTDPVSKYIPELANRQVGVETPAQRLVEGLGPIDLRHRDDHDLEPHLSGADRRRSIFRAHEAGTSMPLTSAI